jgi:hypothetical protein
MICHDCSNGVHSKCKKEEFKYDYKSCDCQHKEGAYIQRESKQEKREE